MGGGIGWGSVEKYVVVCVGVVSVGEYSWIGYLDGGILRRETRRVCFEGEAATSWSELLCRCEHIMFSTRRITLGCCTCFVCVVYFMLEHIHITQ
jgi:hypothetical protein